MPEKSAGSIVRSIFAARASGALALLLVAAGAAEAASAERIAMAQAPAPGGRVVVLAGDRLTVADIVDIAEGRANVEMSADGMARVRSARAVIDHYIAQGLPAYGITTMYGADFQTALPPAAMRRFGRINIIQESTRVGDGTMPLIDRGTMRAAWALLVNSFARGFSGASPDLVATLVDRVNANAVPENVDTTPLRSRSAWTACGRRSACWRSGATVAA